MIKRRVPPCRPPWRPSNAAPLGSAAAAQPAAKCPGCAPPRRRFHQKWENVGNRWGNHGNIQDIS